MIAPAPTTPEHLQHTDPDVAELLYVAWLIPTSGNVGDIDRAMAGRWARRILPNTGAVTVLDLVDQIASDLDQAEAYDTYGAGHVRAVTPDFGGWTFSADEEASQRRDRHRADARLAAELAVSVDRQRGHLTAVSA